MEKFLILFPPVKPLTETEAQLFWKENYRDSHTEIKKTIQLDYNFLPIIKSSVVRTHCERIRLNFLWNSVPVSIVNMGDNEVYPCKYFAKTQKDVVKDLESFFELGTNKINGQEICRLFNN